MDQYPLVSTSLCAGPYCMKPLYDEKIPEKNKIPIFAVHHQVPVKELFIFFPFVFCCPSCAKVFIISSTYDLSHKHKLLADFAEYMYVFFKIDIHSIPCVPAELNPKICYNSPYLTEAEFEKARETQCVLTYSWNS